MTAKKSNWGIGITILISGFVIFMLGLVGFASFNSFNLVETDYYQKEINYQDHIDKVKRTAILSEGVQVSQIQSSKSLVITFDNNLDLESITGKAHLFRPSDADLDFTIPIQIDNFGQQLIDMQDKENGLWKIKIDWNIGESGYYFEDIVILGLGG